MVRQGYITPQQADAAWLETLRLTPPRYEMRAPHFVMYVRQRLEAEFGREMVYKGGLRVYTTLDPHLQDMAQRMAQELRPTAPALELGRLVASPITKTFSYLLDCRVRWCVGI
jgi:membrane peptidoglycan carboxypeptidase